MKGWTLLYFMYTSRDSGDLNVHCVVIQGGLRGSESTETLTAFVLIALAERPNSVCCQESAANIEVT